MQGGIKAESKRRDRHPSGGWRVPLPYHSGGGDRGMRRKENAARRKARAVPVHGAAEMAGDALA